MPHGRDYEEFRTGMAQTMVKHNQKTESKDEQRGNQNRDIAYESNAGNSQNDETENPSVYIKPRNIGIF